MMMRTCIQTTSLLPLLKNTVLLASEAQTNVVCLPFSELSLDTLICANYWTPPYLLHPPTMLKSAASAQTLLAAAGIDLMVKASEQHCSTKLADKISALAYISLPS